MGSKLPYYCFNFDFMISRSGRASAKPDIFGHSSWNRKTCPQTQYRQTTTNGLACSSAIYRTFRNYL